MKKALLILAFCLNLVGCITYPTIDVFIPAGSHISFEQVESSLAEIYEQYGFIRKSEYDTVSWLLETEDGKHLAFYIGHYIGPRGLAIRVLSHSQDKVLTEEIGEKIQQLMHLRYPEVEYEYRYWQQSSPFS